MALKRGFRGGEGGRGRGPLLKERGRPLGMEGGLGGVMEVEEREEVDSEERRGVVEGFHCRQTFLTLSQKLL